MKSALFTGVFRNDPFEIAARKAAELGYDGLEIRALSHLAPDSTPQQVQEVKRIAENYGLEIPVIYSNINGGYANSSDADAEQKLELLKKYAGWASELGAGMICHGPGGPSPDAASEEDYRRAAKWLGKAADVMAAKGLKLVMEIHHGGLVETVDSTLKLLDLMKRDNAGAILDPGNMAIVDENYGEPAVSKLGGKLLHVHVKDVRFLAGDPEGVKTPQYRNRRFVVDLMGRGHVDHRPAYRALMKTGYRGYISLEAQVTGVTPEHIAEHELHMLKRAIEECGGPSE